MRTNIEKLMDVGDSHNLCRTCIIVCTNSVFYCEKQLQSLIFSILWTSTTCVSFSSFFPFFFKLQSTSFHIILVSRHTVLSCVNITLECMELFVKYMFAIRSE